MPPYYISPAYAKVPLPNAGYKYLKYITDDSDCIAGRMVNVMGLVKDFRLPIATRGNDYKAQLTLTDLSNHEEYGSGVTFNMFQPVDRIQTDISAGDIVIVIQAKVQQYGGGKSLLTSRNTEIFVFDKHKIPRYPMSAKVALKSLPQGVKGPRMIEKEYQYVSWLHQAANKDDIPDETAFTERKNLSLNVRDKFGLLKDVQVNTFRDLVVVLVRDPHDLGDKMTLWVSDYTENEQFFRFNSEEGDLLIRDGDELGYTSNMAGQPVNRKWKGPQGKLSMQVTCYEPHVTAIRDSRLRFGDWVTLRNVHIKFGRNGNNIEGFLREDRYNGDKVQIIEHDPLTDDPLEPRVKAAIRRRRDYEIAQKKMIKSLAAESNSSNDTAGATGASNKNNKKRAADDKEQPIKLNAKKKRQLERAAKFAAEKKGVEKAEEDLKLNPHVNCEHMGEPITPIPKVLEPVIYKTIIEGVETEIPLPFINAKYRTVGRVVDFWPSNIAKFARWRQTKETDCLSDNPDDIESSDDEVDREEMGSQGTLSQYKGPRTWEWRFALQLEDTYPRKKGEQKNKKKKRIWVFVDNFAGQCLLNMDADDVSRDPAALARLRDRLFLLWGDLEEQKTAMEKESKKKNATPRDLGARASNMAFSCCIKQHGVEVKAKKGEEVTSRNGNRWKRVFSIFGVKITS